MCGRYSLDQDLDDVRCHFGIGSTVALRRAPAPQDVRPTDSVVTVVNEGRGREGAA